MQPNIVFIFSDQHRACTTSLEGAAVVTPNLERMASEGIVMRNCISNAPVCTPWRAAFLTGQYPLTNGVFLNDVRLSTDIPTLGNCLKAGGYRTGYVGKWHLDGNKRAGYIPPGPRRQGWDEWAVLNCTHSYLKSRYYLNDDDQIRQWDGYDAITQTDAAVDFINKADDDSRPFALVLSWGPPHNPYRDIPDAYLDQYPVDEAEVRPNCETPNKEELSGYYAHVTALDEQLGRIQDLLEQKDLMENTVFIYTSDHGDMVGSQGEQRKQKPWDESIRVPFVIQCPGLKGEGSTLQKPINMVDLMPTLLSFAGIDIPDGVEGRDLSRLFTGGEPDGDDVALTMCITPFAEYTGLPWRGVRTSRYTYARRLDGPWLLYDNETDPYQQNNMIDQPEYAALQEELEGYLIRLLAERDDPFEPAQFYIDKWGFEVDEKGAVPYTN
ncbi:TPA: sulfatase [Candidatus Latescibacteria bacterium]|nr:sulfatase [Candidatus Latescibacterota bacterium]